MVAKHSGPDEPTGPAAGLGQPPNRQAEEDAAATPEGAGRRLHELQARHVALMAQNEELKAACERYRELYEQAPVGHLTIGEDGVIQETNLTAATLLGMARDDLVMQPLLRFILPEDAPILHTHRQKLFATGEPQTCEIRMTRPDGGLFWGLLEGIAGRDRASSAPVCHVTITDISEREQAEQALRASEERFRAIASNTPDHIFMQDGELRYTLVVNPQLGLTQEDMIGKTDYDFLSQEEADRLTHVKKQVLETGTPVHLETSLLSRSGEAEFFDGTYVPKYDAQGQVVGLIGYFRNVTERKQAEEKLQASEEMLSESNKRFSALFHDSPIGSALYRLIHDDSGRIIDGEIADINARGAAEIGAPRSDLLGKRAVQLFGPEVMTPYLLTWQKVEQTGQPVAHETAFAHNKRVYLGSTFMVGKDHLATVSVDITERRRAEEALHLLSTRHEAILASVPDIIMEVDKDKVYTWANAAGLAFFGGDVIGKEAAFYFEGEQATYDQVAPLFAGSEDLVQVESWQRRKDGERRLLAWRCRVLKDAAGNVTGALSSARDITEHRQAEDALRQSEETAHRTAQHLQMVNQIGAKIAAGLEFEPLLQTIYEQCRQIGDTDTFYIALYDDATGALTMAIDNKDGKRRTFPPRNIKESPGLAGYVIEHRQTLYIPDTATDPLGVLRIVQPGIPTRSIVAVPLILEDHAVGVLSMQSHAPNAYTPEQIRTIELLATQVAIAIQNSRLYEQAQLDITERKRTERSLLVISDTQRQLLQLATVEDVHQLVGRTVHELAADSYVSVTTLDEDVQAVKLAGLFGFGPVYDKLVKLLKFDPTKNVYYLKDMTADELRLFRSGKLEVLPGGLHALTTRRMPEQLCKLVEKQQKLKVIYTQGFVYGGRHFGGVVIFARSDITPFKATIEIIVQQASITLNRIRSGMALQESEERFRGLYEDATLGMYRTTPDGRILMANPALVKMLGYRTFEELASRDLNAEGFEPGYPRAEYRRRIEKEGEIRGHETAWKRKDGMTIYVRESARVARDKDGKALYYEGTVEDVSERHRAENALEESEARYRDLFQTTPFGIFATGRDGSIEDVNAAGVRLLGYNSPQEIVGRSGSTLAAEKDRERAAANMARRLRGEDLPPQQYTYVRRDGSEFLGEASAAILRDHNGEPQGYLTILRDITEERASAEERERLLLEVQTSRTQLQDLSQRLVEAQESERRDLARELHDEVGQVMTAVRTNLEAMRLTRQPDVMQRRVDESIGIVDHALQQVRSLALNLRPALLDDFGLAATLNWYVQRMAAETGLAVSFQEDMGEARLPAVIETACFRVVQGALTNIVRHAHAKHVVIQLHLEASAGGGAARDLEIVVRDDGVGFDVGNALEEARSGQSLGLLTMRERVHLLRGQMTIKSAPACGAEITVHVPVAMGEESEYESNPRRAGR